AACVLTVGLTAAASACGAGVSVRVASQAMEPTLSPSATVKIDTHAYSSAAPRVADIVALHPPAGTRCGDVRAGLGSSSACDRPLPGEDKSMTYVLRVVGLPGDHLAVQAGHLIRNGARESDGYTRACDGGEGCDFAKTITVPAGDYFAMGDNRGVAFDSREWGPVRKSWIVGRAQGH